MSFQPVKFYQTGTFTVGKRGNEPDSTPGIEHGNSTLTFVEASLTRKRERTSTPARSSPSISSSSLPTDSTTPLPM